jgi:hypothetical protein
MHIPKTGGSYMMNIVIDPIRDQLEQNNIKVMNGNKINHLNWHSEIDDNTYVITVLRDPASQAISLYTHEKTTGMSGQLIKNKEFNLLKKDFYNEILINNNYKNFQSKSFMMNEKDDFGLRGNTAVIDEALLEKRLKRVNLLLCTKNLKKNAIKIQEKIFLDFDIAGIPIESRKNGSFFNPYSQYFYGKFSNSEKESLRQYSNIDKNIYEKSQYYVL